MAGWDNGSGRKSLAARGLRAAAVALAGVLALSGCGSKEPETAGAPPRLRVITTDQYLNTVSHVFGPSVSLDLKFPPLRRTSGLLANGAALAGVTPAQMELFQRAATGVAAQVLDASRRNYLLPCTPAVENGPDEACAREFISQTGRLLYRRAMTPEEVSTYTQQADMAAEQLDDFYAGLEVVLEAMLISPQMLFIVESTEPDPKRAGQHRLDAHSLASRLSFFLWNAAPDDQLLKAAESGELHTKKGLKRVVDMMLASPRLEDGTRAFFDDMFAFDDFDALSKDPMVYPFFTGATVADAREQTLRTVVDHLLHKKLDYRDLYTTRATYISPALAPLYQLPASQGWTPYEFPADSPRQGLLTQVSFLAVHSHPGRSSPTLRGKALRELLLCQTVPPPPPDVDFSAVENPDAHYPTQRDRVAAHLQNPSCAGCHKITDPMGLALESFDGAGRFRDNENGNPIDTSGSLDGQEFDNVVGLAQALRDNPGLPSCLVNRLYSYGSGAAVSPAERPLLQYLSEEFAADGYRVPDLMRTIALSRAFSQASQPQITPLVEGEAAPPEASQQITMNMH